MTTMEHFSKLEGTNTLHVDSGRRLPIYKSAICIIAVASLLITFLYLPNTLSCIATPKTSLSASTLVEQPVTMHTKYGTVTWPAYLQNASYVSNVPRVVWAFWFGPPMQGKRLDAWRELKANIGAPLKLLTEIDLQFYNLSAHPIHPALSLKKGLSMNHRSDYLRAYFMHHFGGGYHDIKARQQSWNDSFDVFNDAKVWVHGIAETDRSDIACNERYMLDEPRCDAVGEIDDPTHCCEMVADAWPSLVMNSAYMARPNTPLTFEWLRYIENHLSDNYERLKRHPARAPRCCPDTEPSNGYPFKWSELHGQVFHPMQVKYLKHIRQGLPIWSIKRYRERGGSEDNLQSTHDRK